MKNSAIYTGKLRHRRFKPTGNAFAYSVCLYYVDLAEADHLPKIPGVVGFRREDYVGDPSLPLDQCVRDLVKEKSGKSPEGPIRLLTQISYFGYCFNPVSFYYCFNAAGTKVETIVADITNTPWNERHAYVLTCGDKSPMETFSFGKAFHVSPFLSMDFSYRWVFSAPEEKLMVHMENISDNDPGRFFDATLTLDRKTFTTASFFWSVLMYPLMTFKTVVLIYFQALKLWIKRVPFYPHPSKGVAK